LKQLIKILMDKNYWIDFWENYGRDSKGKDKQIQVLRTLNKNPISEELWDFTKSFISSRFPILPQDKVLDLCSGNVLFSNYFVSQGAKVVSVDISKDLLNEIEDTVNIQTVHSDIRNLDFEPRTFDKIFLYAGIQYLDNKEALTLMKNCFNWLKPGGIVYIGDIPDLDRQWEFYNTIERQKIYFDNLLNNISIVGNWFRKTWFENLSSYLGFEEGVYVSQHKRLIYSNFRFDFIYKKANE